MKHRDYLDLLHNTKHIILVYNFFSFLKSSDLPMSSSQLHMSRTFLGLTSHPTLTDIGPGLDDAYS